MKESWNLQHLLQYCSLTNITNSKKKEFFNRKNQYEVLKKV